MKPPRKKPDISVIVPIYNAEIHLSECVNSILSQTYENFELLLIDDGSIDQSPSLCDRFQEMDSRVKTIHKKNEGPSAARNYGLDIATGDYILFCDADDIIETRMLESLISVIKKYDTDLAICGYSRFNISREFPIEERRISKYSLIIMNSLHELASLYLFAHTNMFGISIWAKMYKAEIIRKFKVDFPVAVSYEEDCIFNLQYFKHVTKTGVINDILYHYRQQELSLSKGYRFDAFESLLNGYQKRQQFLIDIGMEEKLADLEIIFLLVIIITYKKVIESSLNQTQRLEVYRSIITTPEVIHIVRKNYPYKSRLSKLLVFATRYKNETLIDILLRIWKLKSRFQFLKKI